jgi:hypothetical protein
MKSHFLVLGIFSLLVSWGGGDRVANPELPEQTSRTIEFCVTEISCPYSFNAHVYYDGVRAQCWFRPSEDSSDIIAQFQSPGYTSVDLPLGEFGLYMKSGRAHGVTLFPERLMVSDNGISLITPPGLPEHYRSRVAIIADTLKLMNEAVYGVPDTARISFFYHLRGDSLGMVAELSAINLLNALIGGHMKIDTASRSVHSPDWCDCLGVDYVAPIDQVLYLYEALDQCNAVLEAFSRHFPPQMRTYPKQPVICTGK